MRKLFNRHSRIFRGGAGSAFVAPDISANDPPTTPGNLHQVGTSEQDSFVLAWSASGDLVGIAGYNIYVDIDAEKVLIRALSNVLTATITSATNIDNLMFDVDTDYDLYVTAVNVGGLESDYSDSVTVHTAVDVTAPTNITFVAANPAAGSTDAAVAQWTYSPDVTSFITAVVVANAGNPWAGDPDSIPDPDSPAAGTWGAKPATIDVSSTGTYDIYSAVKNASGLVSNVLSSDDIVASALGAGEYFPAVEYDQTTYWLASQVEIGSVTNPAVPPTSVQLIIISSTTAQVTYVKPSNTTGFINFIVEVNEDSGGYSTDAPGTDALSITASSPYLLIGLTPDTDYLVRMATVNAEGTSVYSNVASGHTPAATLSLPAPTINSISATAYNQLKMNITVPADTGSTDFYLAYNSYAGGAFLQNLSIPGSLTSDVYLDATGNTTYAIYLKAGTTEGDTGTASNTSSQVTTPATPAGVLFTDSFESGDLAHVDSTSGISWFNPVNVAVTTLWKRTGTRSLRLTYSSGSPSAIAELSFNLNKLAGYPEIYVQYYLYLPDGTEGIGPAYVRRTSSPNNDKMVRIWASPTPTNRQAYTIQYGSSAYPSGTTSTRVFAEYAERNCAGSILKAMGPINNNQTYTLTRGAWNKIKFRFKAPTSTNDNGIIACWVNDNVAWSYTNVRGYPGDACVKAWNAGYLMGTSNTGFDTTTYLYLDDVTISQTDI